MQANCEHCKKMMVWDSDRERYYCTCKSSSEPACSVAVPIDELRKLEQARVELYEYLNGKLTEQQMLDLVKLTGQIWKVANTKNWGRQ